MSAVQTTEDALRLLHEPAEVFEVRILGRTGAGVVSGYFDDPELAAEAIVKYDGKAEGIYHTINPVDPQLLARAPNRLRKNVPSGGATRDTDIQCRRWLPFDFDAERDKGTSATDDEVNAASRVIGRVKSHLEDDLGWPGGVLVMSGNGGHLYYRIALLNDDAARDMVKRILAGVAKKFDGDGIHVDQTVYNASRIMKIPGTIAAKGENTAERPHRRSELLEAPA